MPFLDRDTAKKYSFPIRLCTSALGGMGAACFCHPFDVIRVQMQVFQGLGFGGTISHVVNNDGVKRGLYRGLSAAFLRQWLYGSFRVGIYSYLLNRDREAGVKESFTRNMLYGAVAGGIGSFTGTPAELALVRLSAEQRLPPAERRGYTHVFNCLGRVIKEEGFRMMWTGAAPTVFRAVALSASLLPTSTFAKKRTQQMFPEMNKYAVLFVGTTAGSIVGCTVCNPFDVVKSRVQQQRRDPTTGKLPYVSMGDCFVQSLKKEGPRVFLRGWTPAFIKLAPYTVISLILTEQLTLAATGSAAL
eukprot:TRINITY_DN34411_c0_g1_i1.p1 TRINITY_DN34411_c0_g1~~TRINITY_DN34411_c0_g1_i1.p1  ORF type:complete len:353 (-),score=64.06 TRINITY_DN34411_c0_g1_i1:235-1140(-)